MGTFVFFEHGMMSMHTPHNESIERFAQLCALLNEGFADRALVLASAGLDDSSWKQLESRWMTQIAQSTDGSLARRFGEAYTAARAPSTDAPNHVEVPASAPRFLNIEAQPWRTEAAAVALDAFGAAPPLLSFADEDTEEGLWPTRQPLSAAGDLDLTAELVSCRPGPVLPFRPSQGKDDESGVRAVSAPCRAHDSLRVALPPSDTTVELSQRASHPPALPFAPAGHPVRRFHRFDSQTGLPLPIPHWVDDAADPTKSA